MAKIDGQWAHDVYVANNVRHARELIALAEAETGEALTKEACIALIHDRTYWDSKQCEEAVAIIFNEGK
jgi:hypothetical protein